MSVFYSKEFNFQEFWEQTKQDIEKKLPTKELFFVSNKGRIRKQWNDPATYGTMIHGYHKFGCKYRVFVHSAVGAVFVGIPEKGSDKLTIDHIDGNKCNNCKENLEWISMKEQVQRSWTNNLNRKTNSSATAKPVEACKIDANPPVWIRYPTEQAAAYACETTQGNVSNACSGRFKSSGGYKFRFADTGVIPLLDGEEWRKALIGIEKKSNWMVSNLGRVMSATGIISFGSNNVDGYMSIVSNRFSVFVHNMVGYTFIGPPPSGMIDATIDHIDRNSSNNNVSNLRWASKSEQTLNRTLTKKVKTEAVIYGRKKGEIRFTEYKSIDEAVEILYVNRNQVIACCRGEQESTNGYEFKTEALEYSNLPGEVWQQFFIEHYNALKELPLPTFDIKNQKKRRLEFRSKRKEEHAVIKQKNAAKKRKIETEK